MSRCNRLRHCTLVRPCLTFVRVSPLRRWRFLLASDSPWQTVERFASDCLRPATFSANVSRNRYFFSGLDALPGPFNALLREGIPRKRVGKLRNFRSLSPSRIIIYRLVFLTCPDIVRGDSVTSQIFAADLIWFQSACFRLIRLTGWLPSEW